MSLPRSRWNKGEVGPDRDNPLQEQEARAMGTRTLRGQEEEVEKEQR